MKYQVPQCPNCKEGMVSTYVFPYKEFACLPCGTTDEFFPHNDTIEVDSKVHDNKRELWRNDLSVLGLRNGGKCIKCSQGLEGDCPECIDRKNLARDPEYKFEYYLSNRNSTRS